MSARPVRVRLTLGSGPGPEIDAYPTPVPRLVIHRTFGQPDDLYTVTQQYSGVAIVTRLPSPEAALGCAADLGKLADWTVPVDLQPIHAAGCDIASRWGSPPVRPEDRIPDELARAIRAIL